MYGNSISTDLKFLVWWWDESCCYGGINHDGSFSHVCWSCCGCVLHQDTTIDQNACHFEGFWNPLIIKEKWTVSFVVVKEIKFVHHGMRGPEIFIQFFIKNNILFKYPRHSKVAVNSKTKSFYVININSAHRHEWRILTLSIIPSYLLLSHKNIL